MNSAGSAGRFTVESNRPSGADAPTLAVASGDDDVLAAARELAAEAKALRVALG